MNIKLKILFIVGAAILLTIIYFHYYTKYNPRDNQILIIREWEKVNSLDSNFVKNKSNESLNNLFFDTLIVTNNKTTYLGSNADYFDIFYVEDSLLYDQIEFNKLNKTVSLVDTFSKVSEWSFYYGDEHLTNKEYVTILKSENNKYNRQFVYDVIFNSKYGIIFRKIGDNLIYKIHRLIYFKGNVQTSVIKLKDISIFCDTCKYIINERLKNEFKSFERYDKNFNK